MSLKLLTPEDVADRLTVNAATVRAWLRKGSLKGIKIRRKVWRISEVELDTLLSRNDVYFYNTEQTEHSSYGKDLSSLVKENQSEVKESLVKDLDELSKNSLQRIHDLVIYLKMIEAGIKNDGSSDHHASVRQASSGLSESLTDVILKERDERL